MIDLAPGHKHGLIATSPIWLAGGIIGIGDTFPPGLEPSQLGGVVVGPIQRHPSAGTPPPRLAQAPGLFVLETGLQNRGVSATIKRYVRHWSRLQCPVVVQLADTEPHILAAVVERLSTIEILSGFELILPRRLRQDLADPGRTSTWLMEALRAIIEVSDLPVWVKLPLDRATLWGPAAVDGGAVGLVLGEAPRGLLISPNTAVDAGTQTGMLVRGSLYGPALFPLMLAALDELCKLALPAAIIACGGIHTAAQAAQVLAIGASAVQIDSAAWVEPGLPIRINQVLLGEG